MPERIAILGATGSIGSSTLDIIESHPGRFRAEVLTAHRQADKMAQLAERFEPSAIVMTDSSAADELRALLASNPRTKKIDVRSGGEALAEVCRDGRIDCVVAGIVGAAGLKATLAAAGAGKKILLANKEALVMAGILFVQAARRHNATILPIDSEHNAIFQCLGENYRCFEKPKGVTRILLTASGGPFRQWAPDRIAKASVGEAIAHPNWSMGKKISVDSATMMNKGLELIEAHWLFGMPEAQIEVVVHPQSVVHSMVEFEDGSVLAQLGSPDMRTPIACAMGWPERVHTQVERLNWTQTRRLDFEAPNHKLFPSLEFARAALKAGGCASAVLNAANEIAVDAFLNESIRFGQIFEVVEKTMDVLFKEGAQAPESLDALLEVDQRARQKAQSFCREVIHS